MSKMDSFIAWILKHKTKTLILIIVLFLLPLIIANALFKWYSGFSFLSAEWSAGDLIVYIAGFEAFIGTVILGFVAAWQTARANNTNDKLFTLTEENERKSVLPFLSFTPYITKFEGFNIFHELELIPSEIDQAGESLPHEKIPKRKDSLIAELNFLISFEKIDITDELNDELKKKINHQLGLKKTKRQSRNH